MIITIIIVIIAINSLKCKARSDPLLLFLAKAPCHRFQHLD